MGALAGAGAGVERLKAVKAVKGLTELGWWYVRCGAMLGCGDPYPYCGVLRYGAMLGCGDP